jgi:hypothetical protein
MRFQAGKKPQWKSKPKTSPLDSDADFLKLKAKILSGKMKPFEEAGLLIDDSDGKRLGTKNPARLVRDRLRRILEETNLAADFDITCRLTAEPGVWGVWITYAPRAKGTAQDRVDEASQAGRGQ